VARAKRFATLARLADHKKIGEDRDQRPFFEKGLQQSAAGGRGHLEGSLVGFDLRHHFTRRYRLPLVLPPFRDQALFHAVAEFRHFHR
jgi:hypothetical protein